MKKLILTTAIILSSLTLLAAKTSTPTDTIPVSPAKVQRIIEDKTTTDKGKERTTYYLMINNTLYKITKTHVKEIELAKKYNASVRLAIIPQKKKAIVL